MLAWRVAASDKCDTVSLTDQTHLTAVVCSWPCRRWCGSRSSRWSRSTKPLCFDLFRILRIGRV